MFDNNIVKNGFKLIQIDTNSFYIGLKDKVDNVVKSHMALCVKKKKKNISHVTNLIKGFQIFLKNPRQQNDCKFKYSYRDKGKRSKNDIKCSHNEM